LIFETSYMTLHIGLIGGGNISETHARAARAIPGLEIAAIYGDVAERVQRLAAIHGGTPYTDFPSFLAHRPMELVAIGSPSGLHAEHGIAAAHQGLHVLSEKPLETTAAKADELIKESHCAGVKLGVFFQDRFKEDIVCLKRAVDNGILGRLLLVDARVKWYRPPEYYSGSLWRGTWALDGGGALMNQGSHTVDLLLWLIGSVKRVCAMTSTSLHAIETEDTALALIEFENGATGTLLATTAAFPGYARRIELTGTEGTVILEHDRILKADLRRPAPELESSGAGDENQSASSPVVSDFSGHQAALEDFIEAIRSGSRPRCDGAEGRGSVALIQAIYESSRTGRAVDLPA
jgi:UDP-N-acetyl-2-amino-2-deoxyglucuronate dehydrogenase